MTDSPIAFRNVVRYNRNVEKNVPLYEALGFKPARVMEGFAVLQNDAGVKLILHEGAPEADAVNVTALGFTMIGNDVEKSRAHVEKAGWKLIREPSPDDEGFFYYYGDLDGNPITLVGERRHA